MFGKLMNGAGELTTILKDFFKNKTHLIIWDVISTDKKNSNFQLKITYVKITKNFCESQSEKMITL